MSIDFRALLSQPVDSFEKPKPFPTGLYQAVISGHEFGESRTQKTPYCRFHFRPISPSDDVDPIQFEEAGGVDRLLKARLRKDFWLTDDALYRLSEFLEGPCKINTSGRSFAETIPETTELSVMIYVGHRMSEDGKEVYMQIENVLATED